MGAIIFTIGHSNHRPGHFLGLLGQHEIGAVCDVRSQPYSQMNPQFNRENLRQLRRVEAGDGADPGSSCMSAVGVGGWGNTQQARTQRRPD
jgi:hypothetical protein